LAVIYFELVMGDLPWLASDPPSLLKKILQYPISGKLKNSNKVFHLMNMKKLTNFSMFFMERCLTIDET
jgi:calcium-dependent protein kinase